MSIQNTFYLDVDIKRDNYVEEPQVTQNDDIAFVLRLTDDGSDMAIEGVSTYTLASSRPDGQSVVTVGVLTGPNEVTFELGSTEVSVPGRVKAAIQLYDMNGRVSSIPFTYEVKKDLAIDYIPSTEEETLIQLVLGEGPAILNAAELVTAEANEFLVNNVRVGDYDNATSYKKGNEVGYDGSSYVALQDTQGNLPTDTMYWALRARKGLGDVNSVNGVLPDGVGDVRLDIATKVELQSLDAKVITHFEDTSYTITKRTDISGYGREKKAIVTFISDDAQIQDYTILKPIFESENVPCVIAVPSTNVTGQVGFNQMMTDEQMRELQELGWEICSHTRTHPSLSTITNEQQLEEEIGTPKKELESRGFKVTNFIYPFGSFNAKVKKLVRKYYRSAASVGFGAVNTQPYSTYELRRVSLGSFFDQATETEYANTNTFEGYYKLMIDEAIAKGGWVIFALHPGNISFDATQQEYLRQTIQYAKTNQLPILTMDEALDLTGNIIDVEGYVEGNSSQKYFKIGGDGSLLSSEIATTVDAQDTHQGSDTFDKYESGVVTYTFINKLENRVGLPINEEGVLITDRTAIHQDWTFQTFKSKSGEIFNRKANLDGTWGEWNATLIGKSKKWWKPFESPIAIPANSSITLSIGDFSIHDSSAIFVSPYNPLPDGLIYYAYVTGLGTGDNARIKVTNLTASAISLDTEWQVKSL